MPARGPEFFVAGLFLCIGTVTAQLPPVPVPPVNPSMTLPQPGRFGASLAGANTPQLITTAPSWIGNPGFKLGWVGGAPGQLTYVAYSVQAPPQPLFVGALPINIGPSLSGHIQFLGGTAPNPGIGTWRLPVPALPNLLNFVLFLQVFMLDPAAAGGIATGQAADITVR